MQPNKWTSNAIFWRLTDCIFTNRTLSIAGNLTSVDYPDLFDCGG